MPVSIRAPAAARRRARAHMFPNLKLLFFVQPRFGPILGTSALPSLCFGVPKTVGGSPDFSVTMYTTTRASSSRVDA